MLLNCFSIAFDNVCYFNCLLTVFLGWYIYRWLSRWWLNLPPGPFGFPFIGSILQLEKHAEKSFESWTKNYGAIILVDLASTRTVVLNSYEAVEDVRFVKRNCFLSL